jgi:hypothetical protein
VVAREELLDAELTCGWDVDMRARGRAALTVATHSPQPPRGWVREMLQLSADEASNAN